MSLVVTLLTWLSRQIQDDLKFHRIEKKNAPGMRDPLVHAKKKGSVTDRSKTLSDLIEDVNKK